MKKRIKENFLQKFNFNPQKSLFVGIERESFIVRDGKIQPLAPEIIPLINLISPKFQSFSYELSACQLEMRYGPCQIYDVHDILSSAEEELKELQRNFNFNCFFSDTAQEKIPLDVYPDPTGRYAKIARSLKPEVLHAACYVAGTHVHIGMPDAQSALNVYNTLCEHKDSLVKLGDNSDGERLRYYELMANNIDPTPYVNIEQWVQEALDKGYYDDPRKNWALIRISIHGTIEFRMFGSTPDIQKIQNWVKTCRDLCKTGLRKC